MLDQRRRGWAAFVQMLYKCVVFALIMSHFHEALAKTTKKTFFAFANLSDDVWNNFLVEIAPVFL